jgi:hypothetical protein
VSGSGFDPGEIVTYYVNVLSLLAEFHKMGTDPLGSSLRWPSAAKRRLSRRSKTEADRRYIQRFRRPASTRQASRIFKRREASRAVPSRRSLGVDGSRAKADPQAHSTRSAAPSRHSLGEDGSFDSAGLSRRSFGEGGPVFSCFGVHLHREKRTP